MVEPIVTPSQDMVIGVYYLSELVEDAKGAGRYFSDVDEAFMAYEAGDLALHAPVKIRLGDLAGSAEMHETLVRSLQGLITEDLVDGTKPFETTIGRALLNQAFPSDFPYVDAVIFKSDVRRLIEEIIERYNKAEVQSVLDAIKTMGFHYATRAGLTIGLEDVKTPATRQRSSKNSRPGPTKSRISTRKASSPTMSVARS